MLGSHNSITSYPCVWYTKPFNIFAKCQSKTIEEQLKAGVRFFDFRIRMKADGSYCFAHGLVKYKVKSLTYIFDIISNFIKSNNTEVYFRVFLEYSKKPKEYELLIKGHLIELINSVMKGRNSIHFCGARAKWDYKEFMHGDVYVPLTDKYSSCIGWKRFIHCIPYLYAKKRNKGFKEEYKDVLNSTDKVLLIDFV